MPQAFPEPDVRTGTAAPHRTSLRRRLTRAALGIMAAAQIAAAIVLIGWSKGRLRQDLVADLQQHSRIVVASLAAPLDAGDQAAVEATLRALAASPGFQRACVYESTGRLVAAYLAAGTCGAEPMPDGARVAGSVLVVTPILGANRGRLGTLVLAASLEPATALLGEQLASIAIVLLLSSAAAVIFVAHLQRQLTAPLQHLAATAEAVSQDQNYDRQVPKEADDEVGAVTDAFNGMLRQIKRRDEELQGALRLKDEFLATVSHELRTPLNAMLGWAHVLRAPGISPAVLAQGAAAIERNARWQARLIEDILDVSRIVSGKLRLDPQPTDLAVIVRSAIDVVQPPAEAKNIRIEAVLPGEAPLIGDADRIRQIVWNVLSNAVKFTPRGGQVTVRLHNEAGEYVVAVTDSGPGISADFLPFIFQPFRQADASPTRRQGGLGLGLAIARHLTELSGGSITASSPGAGSGATFTIRLPQPIELLRSSIGEEPAPMAQRWSDLTGHLVLVVDDNEDTRTVLATMLEAHGATVVSVASVAEARSAMAESVPDVLITDLAMPVEDGFGLLEYCRHHADARLQTLPILALTAYGGQEAQDRVIAAGFDAYLAKPVVPVEVGRIVRDLALRNPSSAR